MSVTNSQYSLIETCWTCVNLVATDNKATLKTYLFKIDCCMPSFPCLFGGKCLLENTGNDISEHLEASLEVPAFAAWLPSLLLHHYSLLLKNLLKSLKNFLNQRLNTCTEEEPSDLWDPAFTLGQIENLGLLIIFSLQIMLDTLHVTYFLQVQSTGIPSIFLRAQSILLWPQSAFKFLLTYVIKKLSNSSKNCKIIRYKYIQKIRPGVGINYTIIIIIRKKY